MTKYDYPDHIIWDVKQYLKENGYKNYSEDYIKSLKPEIVLDYYLLWQGIWGYTSLICDIMQADKYEA